MITPFRGTYEDANNYVDKDDGHMFVDITSSDYYIRFLE